VRCAGRLVLGVIAPSAQAASWPSFGEICAAVSDSGLTGARLINACFRSAVLVLLQRYGCRRHPVD
jgi:hypothetical protein